MVVMILRAVVESSPEVGSSRSNKLGFISISWPMLTLFFSPPDIPLKSGPPIMLFLHLLNPSSVITLSTCCAFSSRVRLWGSLSRAVKRSVSFTVRCGYRTSSCATNPVRRLMEPENGWLFMARISPGHTMPVTPFRIVFSLVLDFPVQHDPLSSPPTLYTTSSNWNIMASLMLVHALVEKRERERDTIPLRLWGTRLFEGRIVYWSAKGKPGRACHQVQHLQAGSSSLNPYSEDYNSRALALQSGGRASPS
nr:ABC transporter G family member 6 [Ipomoea batatas]GMD98379.1 ABC transporter G family member 6 [Ipomoea batatas]